MSLFPVLSFLEDLPIEELEQQTDYCGYRCSHLLPGRSYVDNVDEALVDAEEVNVKIKELYLESGGEMTSNNVVLIDVAFLEEV